MSKEYKLTTIRDIFEQIPADKIDICLAELAAGMKQAKAHQSSMGEIAAALGGKATATWPEVCTWIDDDKGNVEVKIRLEIK